MSTTIKYKGSTIATATNATKTLKTAGKYMEGDVEITDVSESGSVISVVDELDENGGTIRHINAVSLEGDTVTPEVLLSGYTAHNAQGQAIVGVATGGGGVGSVTQDSNGFLILSNQAPSGGGLEYEEGTYIPSSDISRPTINFSNTHTSTPISIILSDATGTASTANSMMYWAFSNWYDAFGPAKGSNGENTYGGLSWAYATSSSYSAVGAHIKYLTGDNTYEYMDHNATPSAFYPFGGMSSLVFRSGRTYKWIAVWAPST